MGREQGLPKNVRLGTGVIMHKSPILSISASDNLEYRKNRMKATVYEKCIIFILTDMPMNSFYQFTAPIVITR